MSNLTYILIIAVLCLLLYAVVYKAIGQKKEIASLKAELENEKEKLLKYLRELATIKKDGAEIEKEIKGAESDEEIIDILGDIVSRNNNRVQNDKAKK